MRHISSAPPTLPMTMPAMAPWLSPDDDVDVLGCGATVDVAELLLVTELVTDGLLPPLLLLLLVTPLAAVELMDVGCVVAPPPPVDVVLDAG